MGILYSISRLWYKFFSYFMKNLTELLFTIKALKKFYLARTKDNSILDKNHVAEPQESRILNLINAQKNKLQHNKLFKFNNF